VHDFPQGAEGKAIPYGVYDMGRDDGWINVRRDHDTPAFAVASASARSFLLRFTYGFTNCPASPLPAPPSPGRSLRIGDGCTL